MTELDDGSWTIDESTSDGSVYPQTMKNSARDAAARLLQLMDVGPVAPQTIAERIAVEE